MEFTRRYLPMEWEERWRRDKEKRKRVIEEGGEKIEEENRRLRWIKAYNDNRMGVKHSVWQECTGKYRIPEDKAAGIKDRTGCGGIKQIYHSDTYTKRVFQTLENFRHCSLLTDLTLSTQDGQSLRAHSPVVAAVSFLVQQKLKEQVGGSSREIQVNLGPEVTHLGLDAVLEFAYTGALTSLSRDMATQVQIASHALGVPRVLDLFEEEEREEQKDHGDKEGEEKKKRMSASEQLDISLQAIKQLWTENVGCDIVLQAEEKEFTAHRVILAASSDYFRGMFASGMRESQERSVSLLCLGDEELEAFLHCSYSGTLELTWDCIFDLVCSALQFQIQPALTLCLDFLEREINADSCLDVASFAEAYGMGDLLELADDYILRHFLEVSTVPKFQDLSAEKLLEYLRCDGLCAPSELTVFRAVVSWLEADLAERLPQAPKLMTGVRFPLMTFREFREVRDINLSMECSTEGEVELYRTAFKDFGFGISTLDDCFRVRRPKDTLVLIGGDQLDQDMGMRIPSRQLWFANALRNRIGLVKDIEWRMLGEIPEQPHFRHGAAVLVGKLYVIGGCHFYAKNDTMKSGFCYDPLQNTWQKIADMHEPRSNFTAVVRENRLYAIGGDKDINTNLDSVEVYCPDSNSWSFARPLDQALSGHAAVVWEGEIFISGGLNCDYKCLVSMCLYHPEKGTLYLSDMAQDRALHCMECLGGRFYIAGGVCNFRKFYANHLSCEVYDPSADSWCTIAPLPIPHVGAASAILEERLYILGGYCQEDYSDSRLVHRYDLTTARWLNVGIMPGPNTDIRACVFRLPTELRK
ncbi:kelch-like protein 33 [Alosa pseudoharengus]|uniref:kelch-like protein 33 n=1 Tax=Alosa pseudoharengus TaxID=34774 RepID=UPI003F8C1045